LTKRKENEITAPFVVFDLIFDLESDSSCQLGFIGPKCELEWDQGVIKKRIGTTGSSGDFEGSAATCSPTNAYFLILTAAIGGAVAISVLAIILGVKVYRLSRKPKVHRRFIVARSAAQRSRLPSGNLCEMIDIENCCNMTVCETVSSSLSLILFIRSSGL